ncbi:DUF1836 domain-containing protein [Niameybacter massiliensis]|uniref:DUF1836 domain-containing protein n=1 Tax=Holtiella tumoricola TaxID=3018743 RepID=A0AA42J055_9FIRM|nr:DUF1836 domain-containing protein [Holtiella tumoricola]MDA3730969.1 DUF1836 domain-containing protein [Holtiella tumoricola]
MEKKWLEEQVASLRLDEHMALEDIPNLDLYMDQLITLFESNLSHTKRHEDDKLLTKTMINNYTKDKVLMPAHKKKYTKDHIVLMLLLYQLKSIISISDIKDVFSVLKQEDNIDSETLTNLYKACLNSREKEMSYFELGIEKRVDTVNEELDKWGIKDEKIGAALLVFTLIEQAIYHKRLAEIIIDKCIK